MLHRSGKILSKNVAQKSDVRKWKKVMSESDVRSGKILSKNVAQKSDVRNFIMKYNHHA